MQTISHLPDALQALEHRLDEAVQFLHIDVKRARLAELEELTLQPHFWDDAAQAQTVMTQASTLRDELMLVEQTRALLEDTRIALDFALEAQDESMMQEAEAGCTELDQRLSELELAAWFSGKFDHGDAVVTITPGQGGLEAQDWTEMLFKMYLKYCDKRGWKVRVNNTRPGVEIGLDRATFTVMGVNAYGMLSAEMGVHRLVRISPTDEKKRRQTTFAGVEVLPILPDDIEVDIDPNDLRIDVYRSSGPGGQSVNTTDSAVRITHLPTNTVVTCQNEKSQIQNKACAMQILRSRLYELEKRKREQELDELRGPKSTISWGNQIRSYVLYPYQLIKDLRSGHETGNVNAVLSSGELDPFIVAYHRWRVQGSEPVFGQDDEDA